MSDVRDDTRPPSSFRYQKVLQKGKPVHEKDDSFAIRHPAMDLSKRAKIFSPFDALKGLDNELTSAQIKVTDTFLDDKQQLEEPP